MPVNNRQKARNSTTGRFYSTAALLGAVQKAIDSFMAVEETRVEYLSPLQERLLDYLIRHENLLVPVADLLREVWQQTVEEDDQNGANQVRCNIKRLRHKLARMPSARYQIITVRGRGYKLARK